MSLKPFILFFSICLVGLFSLDALADESYLPNNKSVACKSLTVEKQVEPTPVSVNKGQGKLHLTKPGLVKNSKKEKDISPVSTAPDNSNLSFNFIYYILYKFKYIDVFGLSETDKPLATKKEEPINWH